MFDESVFFLSTWWTKNKNALFCANFARQILKRLMLNTWPPSSPAIELQSAVCVVQKASCLEKKYRTEKFGIDLHIRLTETTRNEIQKCQKYRPLHFPFCIKMVVNPGGVVVGDGGAVVLQYTGKDILVYLGQKASCNSVASPRILLLISVSERRVNWSMTKCIDTVEVWLLCNSCFGSVWPLLSWRKYVWIKSTQSTSSYF